MVSFTLRPLLLWGNSLLYPHYIGVCVGPRTGVNKRKFLTLPRLELGSLGRPACSQLIYRKLEVVASNLDTDTCYTDRLLSPFQFDVDTLETTQLSL
jgi:hypothetical protein